MKKFFEQIIIYIRLLSLFIICANADLMKSTQILFNLNTCQYISTSSSSTMGCVINTYIGSPQQSQQVIITLASPFQYPIGSVLNAVINSRCNYENQCSYSSVAPNQGSNFYKEYQSSTMEMEGGQFTQTVQDAIQFQGDYESDLFYLFKNDEPIRLNFISVNRFQFFQYMSNGVINLARDNQNNLFLLGYKQDKLITPKFFFDFDGVNASLQFNQITEEMESAPSVKTFSNDVWDLQVAGFDLGDESILNQVHFQTIIVQISNQVQIPYNIGMYMQKKYKQYFSQENYWELVNCDFCSCADELPDLNIYTSEYKIVISSSDYTYQSNYIDPNNVPKVVCRMSLASKSLIFGSTQIFQNKVIFNPQEGSLQLPGAVRLTHPPISYFYPLIGLSSSSFIFLLALAFQIELKLNIVREEFNMYRKLM